MTLVQSAVQNKLLRLLSPADFQLLAADLEYVTFSLRDPIESPGEPIDAALFIEDGIASIVAKSPSGGDIEIALVGLDGMTGTSLVLGSPSAPLSIYIQLPGSGHRIAAGRLLAAIEQSRSLQRVFLLYVQTMFVQTATTALVNAQAEARTRLARWLLMVHDRTSGHDLSLTHEFMAVMLGMRRPWVTETLHSLEAEGHIRATRGKVAIVDRAGLMAEANGFYGEAEREYEKLLGERLSRQQR
ncbi:Crp/Fnr family transcriptional regulator [Phyllobacterium chamaecytisi]|uniref:Crp/Fnr family transcriptional regulator n=1 Tax=Phyllobacterium chamaecytisi TaxID=2876082 RepID=UPI001CCC4986|nr:Crp/Fnr family transcriptional regulator [Phyllobacterium sp. KW56]MBZ9603540.1 Crp/Fnr family transcriptional regulator [Phyllobacterium sp. KW56]